MFAKEKRIKSQNIYSMFFENESYFCYPIHIYHFSQNFKKVHIYDYIRTMPKRLSQFIELGIRLQCSCGGPSSLFWLLRVVVLITIQNVLEMLVFPGYVYRIQCPNSRNNPKINVFNCVCLCWSKEDRGFHIGYLDKQVASRYFSMLSVYNNSDQYKSNCISSTYFWPNVLLRQLTINAFTQ